MFLGVISVLIKRVYIEITNVCNLNCSFCSKSNRIKRTMTAGEFERILKQISTLGVPLPQVYLHVKGEPLLHKDLGEILQLCANYGFAVNVTTNGTLLEETGETLLNSPSIRQINISLHSFERGGNVEIKHREYLRQVTDFALECKRRGTPTVAFRLWKCGSDNLDESAEFSKRYLIGVFGQGEHTEHSGKSAVRFCDNVFLNFDSQFEWPSPNAPLINVKGKCLGGKEMLAILADGTVTACCLDSEGEINLGNIFDSDLIDITTSQRYLELIKGFSGGIISESLCKKCSYRRRFDKGDKTICAAEKRKI